MNKNNIDRSASISKNSRSKVPWFHLLGIVSILSLITIWVVLSEFRIVPPLFLPSPSDIFRRFLEIKDSIAQDFLLTFYRMMVGYIIGCSLGIITALLMGWSKVINAISNPIIQILKPIPPLALIPFILLWWGTDMKGVLFLVIFGCFFVMVINGIEAIKNVPQIYKWAGGALGEKNGGIYRRIILPMIMPNIIGAFRVSTVIAFNLVVLAEFNIGSGGLGDILIKGYRFLRPAILFLGIICVVLLALVIDLLIIYISRKIIRWT